MLGLAPVGVPRQATGLPQAREVLGPPGHQLVHVPLVAGVPDDAVPRGVKDPVEGQGQLDHPQVGPEVPPSSGHRGHQEPPDLGRQVVQLGVVHRRQGARGQGAQGLGGAHHLGVRRGRLHDQWMFTRARIDWRSELMLAIAAVGS